MFSVSIPFDHAFELIREQSDQAIRQAIDERVRAQAEPIIKEIADAIYLALEPRISLFRHPGDMKPELRVVLQNPPPPRGICGDEK